MSSEVVAMDAKDFFAREETAARDIRQLLKKQHAVPAKEVLNSTPQKFGVGDPVCS